MPCKNRPKPPPSRPTAVTTTHRTLPTDGARSTPSTSGVSQTRPTPPRNPTQPLRATYAQPTAPNAAVLHSKAWHFDKSASSIPVTFATSSIVPPPAPIVSSSPRLDLTSARILLAGPAPTPSADVDVAAAAASRRHRAQIFVDNVGADAGILICSRAENVLLPTPGSCAVILQLTAYNCPRNKAL